MYSELRRSAEALCSLWPWRIKHTRFMGSEEREGNPMDEFRRREAGRCCVDQLVFGFRSFGVPKTTRNTSEHARYKHRVLLVKCSFVRWVWWLQMILNYKLAKAFKALRFSFRFTTPPWGWLDLWSNAEKKQKSTNFSKSSIIQNWKKTPANRRTCFVVPERTGSFKMNRLCWNISEKTGLHRKNRPTKRCVARCCI